MGQFLGKQLDKLGAVGLAVRTGSAAKPRGANWSQIHGVALLCGVGFTMSLFIGEIAFDGDRGLVAQVKLGVLAGSLLRSSRESCCCVVAATERRSSFRHAVLDVAFFFMRSKVSMQ